MIDIKNEGISNLDTDIAEIIRHYFEKLSAEKRKEVMGEMSKEEFISSRVDVYLSEHTKAATGGFSELGAHEVAIKEALLGMDLQQGEEEEE